MKNPPFNKLPKPGLSHLPVEAILPNISDAVVAIDADHRITYWSPSAERLYGVPALRALGGKLTDVFQYRWISSTEEQGAFISLQHDGIWQGENVHVRADGMEIWVESTVTALKDENGLPSGYLAVIRDVSRRKADESERLRQQARLKKQNAALLDLARRLLNDGESLQQALRHITQTVAATLDVERAGIWLFNEARTAIECADLFERGARRHTTGPTLLAEKYPRYFQAIEKLRAVDAHDARLDPRTSEFTQGYLIPLHISSMLDAPVRGPGGLLGVVCAEHVGPARLWTLDETQFAASVGDLVTLALESQERRRVQSDLQKSEERYFRAAEAGRVGVWEWDIATNDFYMAPNLKEMLGYTEDQLPNRLDAWLRLVHPDDKDRVLRTTKEHVEGRTPHYEVEVRVRRRNGDYHWFLARGSVNRDSHGKPSRMAGTNTCITDQKKAAAELAENQERLQLAMEAGRMGSWEWDIRANTVTWSRSLEQIYGFRPADHRISLEDFQRVIPLDQRERVTEAIRRTLQHGELYRVEYRVMRADGRVAWVEERGKVFRAERGEPERMVAVCLDVTERKTAEQTLAHQTLELSRSNRELEQFAFAASHDLQEPLQKIMVFGDLLKSSFSGIDGKAADYLARMQTSASRMRDLIESLLRYSRVTAQEEALEMVDMEAVLDEVRGNLEASIMKTNARVEGTGLPKVYASPVWMSQLLQNLVGNALKFRGTQAPVIQVDAERIGTHWRFRVRDNGIGIDPKHFDRVFQMFQRLNTAADYPGSGLGLAICKKIVQKMGGHIWVESQPGQGSTFTFTLPAPPASSGGVSAASPQHDVAR